MPGFIGGLPAQGSPLSSSEIRENFLALNARTGKITPRATNPASASITIDAGVVYFSDKISVDLEAQLINLGDVLTGVNKFTNAGFFKDIVVALRLVFDSTSSRYTTSFIFLEGPEKASSGSEPALVPLSSNDLPIARFVVRHNGINLTDKGQIEPITQSSILDYRNYVDVGGNTYFSASVGDRQVQSDAYGVLATDAYGIAEITGETIGSFTGTLDNVNPIQQAIDSLSTTGGTIFIKRGLYQISSSITVPDNVQLVGEGRATTIELLDTFSGPLFNVTGDNVQISNLHLKGSYPSIAFISEALIRLIGATGCSIRDCYIEGGLTGIEVFSSNRNIISHNFISNNNTGISLTSGSEKNIISSNQFENNTADRNGSTGTNNILGNEDS